MTRSQKIILAAIVLTMAVVSVSLLVQAERSAGKGQPDMVLNLENQGNNPEPDPEDCLFVHVAGGVARPGVYRLKPGSRVFQALEMAGGATGSAALDGINLAAPLVDGQQIWIDPAPTDVRGAESRSPERRAGTITAPQAAAGAGSALPGPSGSHGDKGKTNINTATHEQLVALPGIGPSLASAILTYRNKNGFFQTVDQLTGVPGIGPKKLETIRDFITIR